MMTNEGHIDNKLVEAVRIALRDFGEDIIADSRLIGVLKDYHGFESFPQGEFIVRTLIADGGLTRLYAMSNKSYDRCQDYIHRETDRIARQYGFSYSLINTVLYSFLNGMGISAERIQSVETNSIPTQADTGKGKISLKKSNPSTKKSSLQKGKHAGLNNSQSGQDDINLRIFFLIGIALLSSFFIFLFLIKGSDNYHSTESELDVSEIVVASIEDSLSYADTLVQEKDMVEELQVEVANPTEELAPTKVEPAKEPVVKKKTLDPRFYHPDGTHKQPWEYMKYFNEDYDEEDDEEDY